MDDDTPTISTYSVRLQYAWSRYPLVIEVAAHRKLDAYIQARAIAVRMSPSSDWRDWTGTILRIRPGVSYSPDRSYLCTECGAAWNHVSSARGCAEMDRA